VEKPLLIIINGLPGSGKTTLGKRLAQDLSVPVFSRDGIYETLYDALAGETNVLPASIGAAAFSLLYQVAGSILSAKQAVIIEGFFGRSNLRTAEFVALQSRTDFEPLQIVCKADGDVLIERILARAHSGDRHAGHSDLEYLEENKARLISGELTPLKLGGELLEFDTTTPDRFDYDRLLQHILGALSQ